MSEMEEDPEATMAKYMAYRRTQRRNKLKARLLSWVLAMPVAWFAWKLQSYHLLLDWLNTATPVEPRVRMMAEAATVGWAWMLAVLVLYPLRRYLRKKWQVNPERFGLGDRKERENE